ncbi:MAG TPA: LpqB family beta-propeller domain-containing protein [Streptosporangiaceae bacterium]|jgi:two-component system sensor histidine kinase MtrB
MRERRPGRLARLAVAAGLLGLLASGCAEIPSSGLPQSAPTPPPLGGPAIPDCCRAVLRGPQPGWSARQVVKGFLTASASLANDHALARKYLTTTANQAWKPDNRVTILAGTPKVSRVPVKPNLGSRPAVILTGKVIATLTNSGEYRPSTGLNANPSFTLQQVKGGKLLISGLPTGTADKPSHQLLLTSSLFHLVYTPRNLYFYGRDHVLVPDPVFVPNEDTNPATKLIDDLLAGPAGGSLLENAAQTDFPPRTPRPKLQVLPSPNGGKIAIVSFRLPSSADETAKQGMATQLVATLTSSAYSPALFRAVKFKINGKFWAPRPGDSLLDLSSLPGGVPHQRAGAPLYYLDPQGHPRLLGSRSTHSVALGGGQALGTIAVSPSGRYFAGTAAPGTTVYTSGLDTSDSSKSSDHPAGLHLRAQLSGTGFKSLSWDSADDLWIAGRRWHTSGVWVLPAGRAPATRVTVVPGQRIDVTAIQVAPDGTRVAMILGSGTSAQLVLGAAVEDTPNTSFTILRVVPLGPGLSGVKSITWYDEDHLLAVTVSKSGPQTSLWEVPANGDTARPLNGQSGSESITTAGPKAPLYLSLSTGQIEKSVALDEPWTYIAAGSAATYPG